MITRFICLKLTDFFLKISSENLRTSKEMETSDSISSETLYTMKDMRCQALKYIFDGHPRQNLSSWSNVTPPPPGLQSWLNQSSSNAMQMWWLLKLYGNPENMHQECYGCQAQWNSETNPRRMHGNFKKRWHLLFLESTDFFLPVEADLVFQSPPLFLLWYES